MIKSVFNFTLGFIILMCFYYLSIFILHVIPIKFPPTILGLILFATAMICGIIKEKWIEKTCNWLIKNMAMFLLPFLGGLVAYQNLIIKNLIPILLVIFITTTLGIVLTGLIIEYGLAFLRLYHIRGKKHD